MDFIKFHIAYLLTKHKHVIVPDFGAFIVTKVKEDKLNKRGMISPPVKYSLSFNPEFIKDDGLLVHSIAKEKNISNEEALRLVYEYVDSLVDDLRRGQTIQFPWIGKIHLSEDRKIVFTPVLNLSCNASNCGFVNLSFPYLSEISEDDFTDKSKKDHKRPLAFLIIAIVLIAVLGVLMIVTPLTPPPLRFLKERFSCLISLSDMKTVRKDTFTVDSSNAPITPIIDFSLFTRVDSTAPVAADSIQIVADSVQIAVDSVQTEPQYHIIIASSTEEKEAEEILNYLMSKGIGEVKIIRSDGKYRISIKAFTNKEEAVSFLNLIRKEQQNLLFKDVWILEGTGQ